MPKLGSKTLVIGAALLFFIAHLALQFFAWASHPGNSAVAGRGSSISWSVASFPLFYFVPDGITTRFFQLAMIGNSLIWSAAFTWLAVAGLRRLR